MTEKRLISDELPITVWNKERKEWETIHMMKKDGAIYVSSELYSKLQKELEE